MQEQPDDEAAREGLDRLFRKSAEEFEPAYEPAAWPIMNAKLDEHDRITAWGRVLRWGLAVMALLVLVSAGWYGYQQSQNQPSPQATTPKERATNEPASPRTRPEQLMTADNQKINSQNTKSETVALQPDQAIAGRPIDYQPIKKENSSRRGLNSPVVRQHFSASSEGNSPRTALDPQTTAGLVTPNKPVLQKPLQNRGVSDRVKSREIAGTTDVINRPVSEPTKTGLTGAISGITGPKEVSNSALGPDSATANASEQYRIGPVDALGSRGVMRWPQWATLGIPAPALSASTPTTEKSATPIRERGLSIRIAVSPDLSVVGIKNFTRPGTNYGFLLEYRFTNRFSAQAGLIRSKKVYTALPEQYAWPANWKWYVKPIGVEGRCDILDIPINLRYDFALRPMGAGGLSARRGPAKRGPARRGPARWFVSSGVTTYIMQQETYDYQYENPEDPRIKNRSWSGKTGRYTFSNLNLSVGYERPLGKRFAWQVEPFVKMPLKGVGRFNVNLLSTGAFVSLRYRL